MTEWQSEIHDFMRMTEDALLASIGTELVGKQALPSAPGELVARAQRWLQTKHELLERAVCGSDHIKQFVTNEASGDAQIAAELVNVLMSLVLPVNPVTLAVLLAKRGLKKYCAARWAAPAE